MYEVIVLRPGYAEWIGPSRQRAAGTITLVKGPLNIIVDTGTPIDKPVILEGLEKNGLKPEDIDFVVCTCGESDHIGNINVFPNATFIVSYDISKGDVYSFHPFPEQPIMINDDVLVISTPGHSKQDITVLVKRTRLGTVAITGDLFEREDDIKNESLWRAFSQFPNEQIESRRKILTLADYIVPGHGNIFKVKKEFKEVERIEAPKVIKYLEDRLSDELRFKLQILRDYVSTILKDANIYFRYFSSHDIGHVHRVRSIVERLIPGKIKGKIGGYEAFLLLSAIECHDIGMALNPGLWSQLGIDGGKEWEDTDKEERDMLRKRMRENHAEIGARFIERNPTKFGLNMVEASHIANLVRAHPSKFNIHGLLTSISVIRNSTVQQARPRFLGGVLRLVDALDCSYNRAPLKDFDWRNVWIRAPDSRIHWIFKMLISDVKPIYNGDRWLLEIHHVALNKEQKQCIKMFEGFRIKKELKTVEDILSKSAEISLPYKDVILVWTLPREVTREKLSEEEYRRISDLMEKDESKTKLENKLIKCAQEIARQRNIL